MPDLIDDGTWREAALARTSEGFVMNRGLSSVYMLMATAHRYAIGYIEQASVPLSPPTRRTQMSNGRAFVQEQFRKICESKARLRMHSYGLPLPLRLAPSLLTFPPHRLARRVLRLEPCL